MLYTADILRRPRSFRCLLRANPKLLLAMKQSVSVASSDTLLNKHIKWFGCTSRYVSHSAIIALLPVTAYSPRLSDI